MIDKEKINIVFGIQPIHEYYESIIIPQVTFKEKIVNLLRSTRDAIRKLFWLVLTTIGLCLQIGSLAYLAGIMFIKGAS